MNYSQKYSKYKQKYLQLKKSIIGGMFQNPENEVPIAEVPGNGVPVAGVPGNGVPVAGVPGNEEYQIYVVSYEFEVPILVTNKIYFYYVNVNALNSESAIEIAWPLISQRITEELFNSYLAYDYIRKSYMFSDNDSYLLAQKNKLYAQPIRLNEVIIVADDIDAD